LTGSHSIDTVCKHDRKFEIDKTKRPQESDSAVNKIGSALDVDVELMYGRRP